MPKIVVVTRQFDVPQPLSAAAMVATMLFGMMSTRSSSAFHGIRRIARPLHLVALRDIFQRVRSPATSGYTDGHQPVTIAVIAAF
jgi:hypothetical protein